MLSKMTRRVSCTTSAKVLKVITLCGDHIQKRFSKETCELEFFSSSHINKRLHWPSPHHEELHPPAKGIPKKNSIHHLLSITSNMFNFKCQLTCKKTLDLSNQPKQKGIKQHSFHLLPNRQAFLLFSRFLARLLSLQLSQRLLLRRRALRGLKGIECGVLRSSMLISLDVVLENHHDHKSQGETIRTMMIYGYIF